MGGDPRNADITGKVLAVKEAFISTLKGADGETDTIEDINFILTDVSETTKTDEGLIGLSGSKIAFYTGSAWETITSA